MIDPDAARIGSDRQLPRGVEMVAFVNPDGSFAAVGVNRTETERTVAVVGPKRTFDLVLPARSVASARWSE